MKIIPLKTKIYCENCHKTKQKVVNQQNARTIFSSGVPFLPNTKDKACPHLTG